MASTGAPRVGQLLRRLGKQETVWHALFTRCRGASLLQYSIVVDSDRKLETGVVKRALEALQTQFPMLRVRVESRSDGHWLVAGSCPSVQLSELPAGDDWLKHHHNKLNNEVIDTAAGPLWSASVLHGPCNTSAPAAPSHRAVLYLSFCHTITDGLSNTMICRQLIENLDRAVRGCEIDDTEPALVYPSVEELLSRERVPINWALVAALARTARALLRRRSSRFLETFVAPFDPDRPAASYACRTVPAVLTAEQTTLLVEQCRRRGVTVTAALSAAVSLAGVRLLSAAPGAPTDGDAVMRTMWLVNARRYVPDARRMCLSAVAAAAAHVAVDGDDAAAFWRVAGDVHSRLKRQLELKLPLLAIKAIPLLARPDKMVAAMSRPTAGGAQVDYNINNTGLIYPTAPSASAVRAVELHRAFCEHPALQHAFGSHCFHTVGGRLCYDLNYLSGRVRGEDARRFSELVVQLVREATVPAQR